MSPQKVLPVLTSIAIILVVAVLRDRSRAAAAVLATMPLNIPLALWVVASGAGEDPVVVADFTRSLVVGLVPSFIWLGVVFVAVRAGWGVLPAIGAGYAVWVVLIAGLFWFGVLAWPRA
jgi:hypothetical protein